ncbi:hypothetical protein G5I_01265 [Acromyrmex echinatior]|uniref:Uncharacterized protein n=1 Tax=Acromyrmex echinatior TaxID=103372 RepID=F4W756_ACREC|nr:hypothetical protein G5I_01265 [Acromyrmex echinatior]
MSRAARPCDSFNQSLGCVLLGPELTTSDHATKPVSQASLTILTRARHSQTVQKGLLILDHLNVMFRIELSRVKLDSTTLLYAMEDINSCNRPREEAPPEFADEWKRGT